jgi:hypothetical protein
MSEKKKIEVLTDAQKAQMPEQCLGTILLGIWINPGTYLRLLLQINKFNQLKNKSLKDLNLHSFFQFFKQTCQNWISDLELSISIDLTDESLHYLIQQSHDAEVLNTWILDAVELVKALHPFSDRIEIEPIHLQSVTSTLITSASSISSKSIEYISCVEL